jgi:hypothetical protein
MPHAKHIRIIKSMIIKGCIDLSVSNNGWQWTTVVISKSEAKRLVTKLGKAINKWDKESNVRDQPAGASAPGQA